MIVYFANVYSHIKYMLIQIKPLIYDLIRIGVLYSWTAYSVEPDKMIGMVGNEKNTGNHRLPQEAWK